MSDAIYASDPDALPDSEYVPGELGHLVVGNLGRMLDERRTPIMITALRPEKAAFELEVLGFEDAGARWELALEEVGHFQFSRDASTASSEMVRELEGALIRFNRPLAIDCDAVSRQATLDRIANERQPARDWIRQHPSMRGEDLEEHIAHREGDCQLAAVLGAYLAARGVAELDRRFSETFVSHPRSGEVMKGHAIVLAELGLCPYQGQIVRDPELFAEPWSRPRRSEHLVARLAFMHELWSSWGTQTVTLYRGAAVDGPLPARSPASFVSATFSRTVAEEHFAGGPTTQTAVMWRQQLPLTRLFMTFLETPALNRPFREAEALLIADPTNHAF